jgi:C-terminal peptidase prc
MRRTLLALGWLLCPAPLFAAPVPAGQPAPAASKAQLQEAGRQYAQNLAQVIEAVERTYVRPVSQTDLIEAALTGLYRAAGVPVPVGLNAVVQKAGKDNTLGELLVKTRADLGNPEALQGRKALFASCRAMLRSLDPFCTVVTGEEAATAIGYDQNFGLGIDLVEKSGLGPLIVKAVVPGGPAQRAGLQAGDHILAVDDEPTKRLSAQEGLVLLNGGGNDVEDVKNLRGLRPIPPPGDVHNLTNFTPTEVRLTVRGPGAKREREVRLVRDHFEAETVQGVTRHDDNSWDYWVDAKKRIAHVRVVALARHTPAELERVLARLDSGDGLRGLILDLRWCPGGYLTAATGCASLFLEDGIIARTRDRGQGEHVYQAQTEGGAKFLRCPVVVLVNGQTTGGGELIAAALQDHKRAAVAGQRTRGKGSIQTPMTVALFGDGGRVDGTLELKLTSGTFVRPNGKALNRFADSKPTDDWGIRPDPGLEFRVSAELGRRLKDWWQRQTLRPGASDKALPLDDPLMDPQRQAALKALLRLTADKK